MIRTGKHLLCYQKLEWQKTKLCGTILFVWIIHWAREPNVLKPVEIFDKTQRSWLTRILEGFREIVGFPSGLLLPQSPRVCLLRYNSILQARVFSCFIRLLYVMLLFFFIELQNICSIYSWSNLVLFLVPRLIVHILITILIIKQPVILLLNYLRHEYYDNIRISFYFIPKTMDRRRFVWMVFAYT